jgi:hypothetical protein
MGLTLAQYEARVAVFLMDTGNTIWPTATLDECIRLALHEYSEANPLGVETVITLPGDGREVALNALPGLTAVTDVWWPYDSAATTETWPPNRVRGFRMYWDDDQPVLYLETEDDTQPQQDDELRLWYVKQRTIQNLDSASATTIQVDHESWIVMGAAGQAAFARATDLAETAGVSAVSTPNLAALGSRWLRTFRANVASLRGQRNPGGPGGPVFGAGWRLDKWDNERGQGW